MKAALGSRKANFLIFICWAAYTTAYIARLNYSASLVEIIAQLGTTKEAAGSVSSFFFFAYGAGQLVNGFLSKKYNTRYSVTLSLVASLFLNLCMSFCTNLLVMQIVWFLNGAFQSILWSSLIKTLSENLGDDKLPNAVVVMSTTVASGTFMAYGLAALFSALHLKWNLIFYVAAGLLGVVALIWFFGMGVVQNVSKENKETVQPEKPKLKFTPLLFLSAAVLVVCAIANGFIKDGVTSWVPSILKETFGVPASLSIIITLCLPIISIFGTFLVKALYRRQKNIHILNGGFYLSTVLLICLILLTVNIKSAPLTLVIFCSVAFLMASINNVITSIVPLYSRDKIDSGLMAGLLNTFCYVGSTLSITLLGKIADQSGWNSVFVCILIFAVIAFLACAFGIILKRKK